MAATSSTQRSNDEQRKSPRHPVFSLALASAVAYWVSRVRLGHELQPHPFTIQLSIGQRWVLSIPVLPIPFIGPPGNLFTFLPWVRKREEQASTPEEDTNDPSRRQDGTRKPRRGVTFAEQPLIATVSNTSARDAVASPGTVKRQGTLCTDVARLFFLHHPDHHFPLFIVLFLPKHSCGCDVYARQAMEW